MRKFGVMFFILSGITILLFQNCSGGYFSTNGRFGTGSLGISCATDPAVVQEVFETTFQPIIAANKCNKCHEMNRTKGDAPFGSADSAVAADAFNSIGAELVAEKMASGHEIVYANVRAEVETALQEWNANGIGQCSDGFYETSAETLDFFEPGPALGNDQPIREDMIGQTQTIEWDLGLMNPPLEGVTVSLSVTVYGSAIPEDTDPADELAFRQAFSRYEVSNLRFRSPNNNIIFEGVSVLLDDQSSSQQAWAGLRGSIQQADYFVQPENMSEASQPIFLGDVVKSNANEWKIKFKSIGFTN